MVRQDADWTLLKGYAHSAKADASARYAKFKLCLQQAAGGADFDDLKLGVVETLPAAEAFHRQEVAAARKAWPAQPAKWQTNSTALALILEREDKLGEAEQLLNEQLTSSTAKEPQSTSMLLILGNVLARQGRWKEAAADFGQIIQWQPTNHLLYHRIAPLLAVSGDIESYRSRCREMLARFDLTTNWTAAHVIGKACLLLPDTGIDLAVANRLAAQQRERDLNSRGFGWSQFTIGLNEYRQGRYQRAVEPLEKALTKSGEAFYRDADACAVLAMARARLGQSVEAAAMLAKATEIEQTRMPKLEDRDLGPAWIDCITTHLLIREAKNVVNVAATNSAAASH
jgi:serine/threonine-protein kinase